MVDQSRVDRERMGNAMMALQSSTKVTATYLWPEMEVTGKAPVRSVNQRADGEQVMTAFATVVGVEVGGDVRRVEAMPEGCWRL